MTSFLEDVLVDLVDKNYSLSDLTFILPSKRAGTFLKKEIAHFTKDSIFAPNILSIEEFIIELSNLQPISNIELLFKFYEVYQTLTPKSDLESFDMVSSWAQMLIGDFNEIDRYLVDPNHIFGYLSNIKALNLWSLEDNQTESVKRYLSFWNRLPLYYDAFTKQLKSEQKGYQGMIYREAVNHLEDYLVSTSKSPHVFVGFNALNKAEDLIIQEMLQQGVASIYWDIDATFINDNLHDAGLFTRQHKTNWAYFKNQPFSWVSSNYSKPKGINIIGAPKQIGQVKYIAQLLKQLQSEGKSFENTAIVLGDESLLLPLLNAIPEGIGNVNITMGLPLHNLPIATLFEALFRIHKTRLNTLYYKDVIGILSHPLVSSFAHTEEVIVTINSKNLVYLSVEKILELLPNHEQLIQLLFNTWINPVTAINSCIELLFLFKSNFNEAQEKYALELEYLFRLHQIFNKLKLYNESHSHIENIKVLFGLYKEFIKTETLDFKGEPLRGLQIMGMLESRVLDFETVIIASVNEGVLPAGKSNNSFIPFDVKLENGLPTYKEKDAVYTYHFYRLIQRAKQVHIIYNTEIDALVGGEKSRFIKQLEVENIHKLNQFIVTPTPVSNSNPKRIIEKTPDILEDLKQLAQKGFSPSALTNYIRNPIDFYHDKLLGIKTFEGVEETVASNTLGNIVHKTLEDLYLPYVGKTLTYAILNAMLSKFESIIVHYFKIEFKEGDFSKGQNLIIFEVAKRYVSNFIKQEINALKNGDTIEIVALEKELKIPFNIEGLSFPLKIKGIVDRIDIRNGTLRIIDYKTGKVEQNKVEIVNWDDLITDYNKYSKSFQILTYAYMMSHKEPTEKPVEAGIISFKNLNSGFLKFSKKDKPGAYAKKETLITQDILEPFSEQLKLLLLEIFNPKIPFIEKEI